MAIGAAEAPRGRLEVPRGERPARAGMLKVYDGEHGEATQKLGAFADGSHVFLARPPLKTARRPPAALLVRAVQPLQVFERDARLAAARAHFDAFQ